MHVYFLTRGIHSTRDEWVSFMKTRMFPWKRKNLTTDKWETIMLKGALRPVELWEYVIPADCLMECMVMQHNANGTNCLVDTGELRPEIAPYAKLMQKLLTLKSIPKFEKPRGYAYMAEKDGIILPVNWVPLDGFAVYPIGIKEDKFQEFPNFADANSPKGYYQEAI